VTERKVEISHDRYGTQEPIRQFTITTLKISTVTKKFQTQVEALQADLQLEENQY
jgi:hypothetical protein